MYKVLTSERHALSRKASLIASGRRGGVEAMRFTELVPQDESSQECCLAQRCYPWSVFVYWYPIQGSVTRLWVRPLGSGWVGAGCCDCSTWPVPVPGAWWWELS